MSTDYGLKYIKIEGYIYITKILLEFLILDLYTITIPFQCLFKQVWTWNKTTLQLLFYV